MKQSRIKYAIELSKEVEHIGTSTVKNMEHYRIKDNILIHNKELFNESISCTCKFHSVKDIHNKQDCVYKYALKLYLKKGDKNGRTTEI